MGFFDKRKGSGRILFYFRKAPASCPEAAGYTMIIDNPARKYYNISIEKPPDEAQNQNKKEGSLWKRRNFGIF